VAANSVYITSSASAFGSRVLPSEEVDAAFGMPIGKLRNRAGIVSLAYATDEETEAALGERASREVLDGVGQTPADVDWILAASETHHAYPSLSALLHGRLGLRENCSVTDVGSGCLALLQALAVAQALLAAGSAANVLVVTADVHSRTLGPGRAAGEFGGLFGDGASAFLLSLSKPSESHDSYRLGEFFFRCAAQYSEAICVSESGDGGLAVSFDGDALSRAAVNRMEKVFCEVERRSGISRNEAGAFATHQPNPRLVKLLAKQAGLPVHAFPPIAATRGNLGPSTCGAALHAAVERDAARPRTDRRPIFLASLGPGLIFGGGWAVPA
jgi:3-oxoacyl-[acyl-carrier-protein] synthase III